MSRSETERVRQGRTGWGVLRVLIIALILCVIGAIGMAIYGYMMPDQTLPDASVAGDASGPSTQTTAPQNNTVVTPQQSANTPAGGAAP